VLELFRSLAADTIRAEQKEAREEQEEREEQGAGGSAAPERRHERPAEAQPADAASEAQKDSAGPSERARSSDLASIVRRLRGNPGSFANLWRHEGALLRSFFRTLHELQRLQAIRAGERVPPPAAVDIDVNINEYEAVNPK
jgi:hypothetical protein